MDEEEPTESDPQAPEGGLVGRTEHLADLALDRLRQEAHLPNVGAEVSQAALFLGAIHSRFLWWTLLAYTLVGIAGTLIAVSGGLSDWYMHVAMYVVIFSFIIIYVKVHLQSQRFARAFYALTTLALLGFFAWVLDDLVAARVLVVDAEKVTRAALPSLRIPAVGLASVGFALLFHWLVLARFRAHA
ncbi:MAG: hypothetical protein R3F39_22120 [Myxococcota bacterium]